MYVHKVTEQPTPGLEAAIGGSVGGVILIVLVIVAVVVMLRRRRFVDYSQQHCDHDMSI